LGCRSVRNNATYSTSLASILAHRLYEFSSSTHCKLGARWLG
jgi:hypothetical protein